MLEARKYPLYPHRNAPKHYTLHQLFALLEVGRQLGVPSPRRLATRLREYPELLKELGIGCTPTFMTLWRAAKWFEANPPTRPRETGAPCGGGRRAGHG